MGFENTNTIVPPLPQVTQNFWDGIPTSVTTTAVNSGASWQVSRLSYTTSNFKTKLATGKLPENIFRYTYTGYSPCMIQQAGKTVYLNGHVGSFLTTGAATSNFNFQVPAHLDLLRDNRYNYVIARLLQKIRAQEWDSAVFAGELPETVRMFRTFAAASSQAIRHARNGNWGGVYQAFGMREPATRQFSNIWLLVNYGILPLARDLFSAVKALERGLLREQYILVKARTSIEERIIISQGAYTYDWSYKLDAAARVKYAVSNSSIATLTSLGLVNPLTVRWELRKLSFVLDWGIGLGTWLANLDATFGKSFVGGSTTLFDRTQCRATYAQYSAAGVPGSYQSIRKYQDFERVRDVREPLVSFPAQLLPVFKDPRGLFQIVTSLALIRQSVTRR